MSKSNIDTDIYGDIYGDEVDLQDGTEDTQLDGIQDEDFLEPVSEPVSPVEENKNKALPAGTADNVHALPPKPSSSQNSLSYSAQIAQQFSAYQQTPSQERQPRPQAIPSFANGTVNGASGAVKQDEAADTIYGKKPSEMHDHGKLFIGGLSWDTTDEGLRNYFQQFGKVDACTIMRDPNGTSRGFAFLTFEDENSVKSVLGKEHILDGKAIDPKRAIPREEHLRNTRFFVGGLSPSTTSESMKEFFNTYGKVVDATVMMDRDTGRSKGFGFVTYEDATHADQLVGKVGLILDDKQIEVKAAQPRSQRDQARNSATPNARESGHSDQLTKMAPNNMVQQQQQNALPMMFNRPMNQVPMMGGNMNAMMNMNPMAMMGMGMGMGGFNPMAMNGMNMMNGGMQGMANMNGMANMGAMGGMPGMGNMGGMRMGMGPMGVGMNGAMGGGGMGGNPNMGGMNAMGMGMRPNITSMGGGMGRMGAAAAGLGPARMSSRGQHNFHPYSRVELAQACSTGNLQANAKLTRRVDGPVTLHSSLCPSLVPPDNRLVPIASPSNGRDIWDWLNRQELETSEQRYVLETVKGMVSIPAFSSASAPAPAKRPRGRPRKTTITVPRPKRPRGRPRNNPLPVPTEAEDSKAGILPSQGPLAAEFWLTRAIQGDQPPFSDWTKRVVDKARNKVYVYGGRPVGQERSQPDLYCCEVANKMTWISLTDQLKYCNPYADPFTESCVMPRSRRLPCLFSPAIAFMPFNKGNYLMLFGGLDEQSEDDRVTDTLIAIDVDKLFWFFVPVWAEHGSRPGPPRMNAAMVAVGEQLFIFSGRKSIDCEEGLSSYSVIKHNDGGKWTWKVPECPYPSHVPSLGYDPQVVATYGGLKVLLLPGKVGDEPINIQPKNMVFFHTSNLLFSLADGVAGNSLPSELGWYHSFLLNPRPPLPSRKNIDANVGNIEIPSVLICGWRILKGLNPDESERLSIELWRYKLTPEDTIECLNVGDKTKKFQKQDFEDAILVGDRLYLLGSEKTGAEWTSYEYHDVTRNVAANRTSPTKSTTRRQAAGGGRGVAELVDEMDVDPDEDEDEEEPMEPRWYNVRMEVPLW